MGWAALVVTLAAFAYSWYQLHNLPTQAGQQIKNVTGPTAEEGIAIPVLFGSRVIQSPNTTWYGKQASARKDDGSIDYWIGLQLALCHGKLDEITQAYVAESDTELMARPVTEDKVVWLSARGSGTGRLNATAVPEVDLGQVMLRMGAVNIAGTVSAGSSGSFANRCMGILDGHAPSYYGVAMVEGTKELYVGTSPQIPGQSFLCKRIHTRHGGAVAQWYDAKSEIRLGYSIDDLWKYKLLDAGVATDYSGASYDDSAWLEGPGGVGSENEGVHAWQHVGATSPVDYPIPPVRTQLTEADYPGLIINSGVTIRQVKRGIILWLRRDIGRLPAQDLGVRCWHDDSGKLWFNGTEIALKPEETSSDPNVVAKLHFTSTAVIPAALVNPNGPNVIAFKVVDSFDQATGKRIGTNQCIYAGVQVGLDVFNPRKTVDMNPVHIIREALTCPIVGAGEPDSSIGASFAACADKCFIENLGLSLIWDEPTNYKDFIADILRYISGVYYVDMLTGKYEMKLLREDYVEADLLLLDGTNTTTIADIENQAIGQLVNTITATYSVSPRGKNGSVTVREQGLIDAQGGIVDQRVDYPAVSTSYVAGRLALRDLRVLSCPLLGCTVGANREAMYLRPGDAFKLNRPDVGIENAIMRVSEIDFGDGIKNEITIKCMEDVFYLPDLPTVASNPPLSLPPPNVKADIVTDDYQTAHVTDARNKGWVETAFHGAAFSEGDVFAGFTEIAPGVMERNFTGPLTADMFDGVNPYTGVAGSGTGSGEMWMFGRVVLAFEPNAGAITGRALQGPYVVDDLGGHWVDYGLPTQAFVATKARIHRHPAFAQSAAFAAQMIFKARNGTAYSAYFLQLQTANVVLGMTEQTWEYVNAMFVDTTELLTVDQLATRPANQDGMLVLSATATNSAQDFAAHFQSMALNTREIPAGPWTITPSMANVTGADVGSTTSLGMKFTIIGAHPRALFEVLHPATAPTGVYEMVAPIVYQAPAIPLEVGDELVVTPTIHTTSATAATLTIEYNAANAIRIQIPRGKPITTVADIDEDWFDVTVVDGVIPAFGSHRKLRVHGTGPLVGIVADGLRACQLTVLFADAMQITVNGSPSSGAPIENAEATNVGADVKAILMLYLFTDSGTSTFWRIS
jgi:hypothetical protein